MQPLKFGLVGAGGNKVGDGRGLSHARHLAALDAGQIVAVCDIAGDAAERVAAQLGATAFDASGRFVARPFPANANGDRPLVGSTFLAPGAPRSIGIGLRYAL